MAAGPPSYRSLGIARAKTQAMARAARNLQAPLQATARQFEAASRASIEQQRSPAGHRFPKLADSTLAQRKPGEFQIALKKTGRTQSQIRVFASRNRIRIVFPGHLWFHIVGGEGGRPPKRNPLPFERRASGQVPRLIASAERVMKANIRAHIVGEKLPDLPLAAE